MDNLRSFLLFQRLNQARVQDRKTKADKTVFLAPATSRLNLFRMRLSTIQPMFDLLSTAVSVEIQRAISFALLSSSCASGCPEASGKGKHTTYLGSRLICVRRTRVSLLS